MGIKKTSLKLNDLDKATKNALKNCIKELKTKPYVVGIYLFGSHAKRKTHKLSDVDIAIVTKEISYKQRNRIKLYLYSFSTDRLDVSWFNELPAYIQKEVLCNGKLIFVKDRFKLAEITSKHIKIAIEFENRAKKIDTRIIDKYNKYHNKYK